MSRTAGLNVSVSDRVCAPTAGRRYPVMRRPGDVLDLPLAAVGQ